MSRRAPSGKAQGRAKDRAQSKAVEAQRELRPGQSVELLKELHILTREGRLNQDSRRKLKQVYHLYQFIEKLLRELPDAGAHALLADHGAGKSYLGFILYDLFFKARRVAMSTASRRAPNWSRSRARWRARLGFERMRFLNLSGGRGGDMRRELPAQIDVVTALHACDTATDDAIAFGLAQAGALHGAGAVLPGRSGRPACARTRRWRCRARRWPSSGAIRCTRARSAASSPTCCAACTWKRMGYQVTVTELVGWEHSMKNELILARRTGQRKAQRRPSGCARCWREFGLESLLETRFPACRLIRELRRHGPPAPPHAAPASRTT